MVVEIIKDILPPWAFVVIVLGVTFIFFTRKTLNKVLDEGVIKIKNRFLNFSRKSEAQGDKSRNSETSVKLKKLYKSLGIKKIEDVYSLLESSKKTVEESKNRQNTLFDLWKYYMFSYFNLFLVARSKLALVWVFNNQDSTKEMLLLNIFIPSEMENKELEREAVFNALLANWLIEQNERDLYHITQIGIDFLKFIGLVT